MTLPTGAKIGLALFALAAIVPAGIAIEGMMALNGRALYPAYSRLRNRELRKEALHTAQRLREHAARARLREIDALISQNTQPFSPPDLLNEYDRQLKPKAIQLRDEVLSRLPRAKRPDLPFASFEFAASAQMIDEAADTLETLAKLLPDMWYREEEPRVPPAPQRSAPTFVT